MTFALASQSAALPQGAAAAGQQQQANPLGALMTRYKRIDPNELVAIATRYAQAQVQAQEQAMSPDRKVLLEYLGIQGLPANASDAQIAAAQIAATYGATTPSASYATYAPATTQQAAQYVQPAAQYVQPAATQATYAAAAPQVQAAQQVQTTQSSLAPRQKDDYWSSHIAQFRGSYLPDGPTMRPNCGPASATMALRMIGLDIPGFNGERSEAVLDKARVLATGRNDTSVGTTDSELERLIEASGARWSESNNLSEMLGWVQQGIPVILAGNPAYAWNSRYSADKVYPFDGGHWVTVSGYDAASGFYIVNDPLSQIGPILVSESELASYTNHHGGLGIAVFR